MLNTEETHASAFKADDEIYSLLLYVAMHIYIYI